MSWAVYGLISAFFAGCTALLVKLGVEAVPSNLATAYRTTIVLLASWLIVAWRGEHTAWSGVSWRSVGFLTLAGLATTASWLAYFKAIQIGPASRVDPLDKLSLAVSVTLAVLVLGEAFTWRLVAGVALMTAGALLITVR